MSNRVPGRAGAPARTGVCLVRIEAQMAGLLITVRHNPDISSFSAERLSSFSEVDPALAEVRRFLERFTAGGPTAGLETDAMRPRRH